MPTHPSSIILQPKEKKKEKILCGEERQFYEEKKADRFSGRKKKEDNGEMVRHIIEERCHLKRLVVRFNFFFFLIWKDINMLQLLISELERMIS